MQNANVKPIQITHTKSSISLLTLFDDNQPMWRPMATNNNNAGIISALLRKVLSISGILFLIKLYYICIVHKNK